MLKCNFNKPKILQTSSWLFSSVRLFASYTNSPILPCTEFIPTHENLHTYMYVHKVLSLLAWYNIQLGGYLMNMYLPNPSVKDGMWHKVKF